MLHAPLSAHALRHHRALARQWADAELVRLRADAVAKLRAAAWHDWKLYSRLANIPRPASRTPAREIIERVAAWHNVSVADLMSRSKRQVVIEARFDAIAAVKLVHRHLSLHGLAKIFDGRDHSTIHNALRRRGISCSLVKA